MTKAELVTRIPQKTGIEKKTIQETLEGFMNTVKESLIGG